MRIISQNFEPLLFMCGFLFFNTCLNCVHLVRSASFSGLEVDVLAYFSLQTGQSGKRLEDNKPAVFTLWFKMNE